MEVLIQQGSRVRFRTREQTTTEKKQKVGKFPNTGFLRNENINTLKIQATPASGLKVRVHKSYLKRGAMADGDFTKVRKVDNFGGQG